MMRQVGKRHGGDPGAAFPFPPEGRQRAKWQMQHASGGDAPLTEPQILTHALQVFDAAAADVSAALVNLRHSGADGSMRTLRAVRDLQAALAVLMDERVKIDRLRNQVAGVVGGRTLDLDAARDEIGRRLARLRDAGGGD